MLEPGEGRSWPADVVVVEADGREVILVGTAHVSRESAELVRRVIEAERPDVVCVELDAQRHAALSHRRSFESLDLRQVIRSRQLAALVANLLLASWQRRMGGALGVMPGSEMLEAMRTAEELGIPTRLCDRDVRITLRRAWASLSLWRKSELLATLLASAFETPKLDEAELRRLRDKDVLSQLMAELAEAMPGLARVLIDERDAYLAQRIREVPGRRVVAVVGAGHVAGMRRALEQAREVDVAALESIPPVSPVWQWLGWGIPVLVLAGLAWIGFAHGAEVAGKSLGIWILANGLGCMLGAFLALAHPLTIAAAFFVAPVTTLSPLIGAGHVLAFLQAYVQPPLVSELETVSDDVSSPSAWWRNRLLRIVLVFALTTIGSVTGNYVGGYEIVSNLLRT
jgi:pheromone shutdown-related protein TraB